MFMQQDLTYTVSPKVDGLKKKSSALKFYARMDDPAINAKRTIDEPPDKKKKQPVQFTNDLYT